MKDKSLESHSEVLYMLHYRRSDKKGQWTPSAMGGRENHSQKWYLDRAAELNALPDTTMEYRVVKITVTDQLEVIS